MFIRIIFFFLILALPGCNLNKINNVHGVPNLKAKIKNIEINKTNKNDIIQNFGPTILNKDPNNWTYFEVRDTRSYYGKKIIYLSDYLEIFFDKYGLVQKFNFYDLKNQKKIIFTENKTESLAIKDTLVRSILSSTRTRLENARKKYK